MGEPRTDPRWRDPDYLRRVQYRDGANLAARANLHVKYGRGDWFPWCALQYAWPAGASVLELGCGPGAFWIEAAPHLPADLALTLTDHSPGMVEAARERIAARWPSAKTRVADAAALPFPDACFDIVVANHVLYHVRDPALGVDEIRRVLRPGGAALIATNGADNLRELWDLRSAVFGGASGDPVSAAFQLENGEPILRARFASVERRMYPDELRCTDPDDVFAYLGSAPPGADATPAQQAALRAAIAAAFSRNGGVLPIRKSVGLFICRKESLS